MAGAQRTVPKKIGDFCVSPYLSIKWMRMEHLRALTLTVRMGFSPSAVVLLWIVYSDSTKSGKASHFSGCAEASHSLCFPLQGVISSL
jgi:hypothetical protein